MVAYNPVFRGKWTVKKFNATVMNDIWPEVLFFTSIAVSEYYTCLVIFISSRCTSGDLRFYKDTSFTWHFPSTLDCPRYSFGFGHLF